MCLCLDVVLQVQFISVILSNLIGEEAFYECRWLFFSGKIVLPPAQLQWLFLPSLPLVMLSLSTLA